jgi:hypothetical protein
MIKVELSKTELRAGEKLTGRAVWNAEGTKTPRKILVEVRKVISGKGMKLEEVIDSAEELDVASKSQITVPFEFEIPHLGPPTYEGRLFSITWTVTARVDLPFAIDEVESATVTVRPQVWTPEESSEFDQIGDEDLEDEDFDEDDEEEVRVKD